ncbi:hypothetical protein [Marinilabilia sp.]|uniref:hypothetical protein n=1 Tax=Marinilabilia sp. TaxID=2021252 RepID=UPI0025BE3E1A|nr:hypothetical protein [Marinilabilia sp.]
MLARKRQLLRYAYLQNSHPENRDSLVSIPNASGSKAPEKKIGANLALAVFLKALVKDMSFLAATK